MYDSLCVTKERHGLAQNVASGFGQRKTELKQQPPAHNSTTRRFHQDKARPLNQSANTTVAARHEGMPTRLHYPRRHIPVHRRVAANACTANAAVRCAHKRRHSLCTGERANTAY